MQRGGKRRSYWQITERPVSSPDESPMPHNPEDGFFCLILIFEGMSDIEKRFAGNGDNGV
jgi:hypothetical protein